MEGGGGLMPEIRAQEPQVDLATVIVKLGRFTQQAKACAAVPRPNVISEQIHKKKKKKKGKHRYMQEGRGKTSASSSLAPSVAADGLQRRGRRWQAAGKGK